MTPADDCLHVLLLGVRHIPSGGMAQRGAHATVSDAFDGKVLLLTGASGFVGKALLEKLLRTCPGIHKIYIIMRSKSGTPPSQRLHGMLREPVRALVWTQKGPRCPRTEPQELRDGPQGTQAGPAFDSHLALGGSSSTRCVPLVRAIAWTGW